MSSSAVLQILVNLIFLAGFVVVWIRLNKPAKDDPRLSRGLQLLQSKIAILEDLSDQVERQVQQVAQLMEVKGKDLQQSVTRADDRMREIEVAMARANEVTRLFQDRIPVEEIADRKATLKYIKAARLANQGASIESIQDQVDLSRGELEFIAKVNRDQLQFSDQDLPDWAHHELTLEPRPAPENSTQAEPAEGWTVQKPAAVSSASAVASRSASGGDSQTLMEAQPLLRIQDRTIEPLNELGKKFRDAIQANAGSSASASPTPAQIVMPERPEGKTAAAPKVSGPVIKKVIFPRIEKSPF